MGSTPPRGGLNMATWAGYVAVPAVPKVTLLRPLQNFKTDSQHRVWVLKSPTCPFREGYQKLQLHGNRTHMLEIMAM
jgi:hypothetical protein